MLIDLLNRANYKTYNIKLAHLIGLEQAIYLEALLELDTNEGFVIDRAQLRNLTTFDESKQLEIEKNLSLLNFICVENNIIKVNVQVIISFVSTADENVAADISSLITSQKKRSKKEVIKDNLKNSITASDMELRQAYFNWIDALSDSNKGLNKAAVTAAQIEVDKFANHDLDVALELLQTATINCYRDMTWAINIYNQKHKLDNKNINSNIVFNKAKPISKSPLISDEVF